MATSKYEHEHEHELSGSSAVVEQCLPATGSVERQPEQNRGQSSHQKFRCHRYQSSLSLYLTYVCSYRPVRILETILNTNDDAGTGGGAWWCKASE